MHRRQIDHTIIKGFFAPPLGISLFQREPGKYPEKVTVSTVALDGAHREDPLGVCDPETGFETMVFLDGSSFLPIHTRHYDTKKAAAKGHREVVDGILAGTLTLSLPINYRAWDEQEKAA